MEDFILREIDRLGEMLLLMIALKLGLQDDVMQDYSLLYVRDEFDKAACPFPCGQRLALMGIRNRTVVNDIPAFGQDI